MWYLAHLVKLALKDALNHTTFDLINNVLYSPLLYTGLYMKNPKMCHEEEEAI